MTTAARAAAWALAITSLFGVDVPGYAADGITGQQADEILRELRQIRQLLERAPRAPQSRALPAQPAGRLRLKLQPDAEFALGNADAPVVIVEFNDLQCPFCSRFHTTTFPEIKRRFVETGKVRFIHRDLPLEQIHPQALRAAQAARCAGEQGRFFEVADRIIRNQAGMSPVTIDEQALAGGVDARSYKACIEGGRHVDAIRQGAAAARSLGVTGTPSFVIGRANGSVVEGRKLVGAASIASFEAAINEVLAK